jgi:hypothetical protein
MAIAGDDIRQVYIKVTGAVGLAALFVTQLPFDRLAALPTFTRWLLVVGVAFAGAAGGLYFFYLTKMHLGRLKMAEYLREGDAAKVAHLWTGTGELWERYRLVFQGANICFGLSIALFTVVLCVMLKLAG